MSGAGKPSPSSDPERTGEPPETAPGSAPPPSIIASRYRVVRELARGGMGVVYVVEHLGTGARLALKLMSDRLLASPKAIARFRREARAPAQIASEHVVRVIDADAAPELGGAPFLVMELLDGEDLDALGDRGPSPDAVVAWLRQAARALDRAHELGFVHRDLKPANLFLARRPEGAPIVKVLDFGIVKMLQDPDAVESGSIVGTPQFMSPEQVVAARGKVGPASDVWAMGHVAFRLLSGGSYWLSDAPMEIVSEILHGPMPPPSARGCDFGPAFDGWFLRSCARAPEARYATVGEQIEALAEALLARDEAAARDSPRLDDPLQALQALAAPPRRARAQRAAAASETVVTATNVERRAEEKASARAVGWPAAHPASTLRSEVVDPERGDGVAASAVLEAGRTSPDAPSAGTRTAERSRANTGTAASRRNLRLGIGGAVVVGACVAATVAVLLPRRGGDGGEAGAAIDEERLASFAPLAAARTSDAPGDAARVALGARLFADPRLSKNGDVACTSCHELARFGTDGKQRSRGTDGVETTRNTPSVFNLPGSFALRWDGRDDDLVHQAEDVLAAPGLMASSPAALEANLRDDREYAAAFAQAFPGAEPSVSFAHAAQALAAYEETLISPGRWDRFLGGDRGALNDQEKAGFNRFVEIGCVTCHFGPHVGATMFQKAGLVKAWPDTRDRGRYEITKREADSMVFRVPSLRNVAVTAPYFHDGSVDALPTAIRMMAHHQLGKTLEDRDVALIAAWLATLTGDPPR